MFENKIVFKIVVTLALVLMCFGMIALISGVFELESTSENSAINRPAGAPGQMTADADSDGYVSNNAHEDYSPIEDEEYCDYETGECVCFDCAAYVTIVFDEFIVWLSPSDISRGNLVLVNNDHAFDLEHVGELVYIADFAVPSFRVSNNEIRLAEHIVEPLVRMLDAFYEAIGSNNVSVISGFRDLARQREILDDNIARMGPVEARRWAVDPGHSEHHTGLAIDFGFYQYGNLMTFLGVGRTAWLGRNAHQFGFIERYPEGSSAITGVAHEPWHFRYVGLPHSYLMRQLGMVLEEYIDFLKGHCSDEPFFATFEDFEYIIYFTRELEAFVPVGSYYSISGTNTDGFIVTIRP